MDSVLPIFINCLRRAAADNHMLFVSQLLLFCSVFFFVVSVFFLNQGRNTLRLPLLRKMVPSLQPATDKYRLPTG